MCSSSLNTARFAQYFCTWDDVGGVFVLVFARLGPLMHALMLLNMVHLFSRVVLLFCLQVGSIFFCFGTVVLVRLFRLRCLLLDHVICEYAVAKIK